MARDHNAAINIKNRYVPTDCGELTPVEMVAGATAMNQEAPLLVAGRKSLFSFTVVSAFMSTYFTINFLDSGSSINRGSPGGGCYRFAAFKTRP